MDTVLLWTIVAILLSSLVGVFLGRRKRDICLKDFHGYMATALFKNGKRVWGRLVVETSGLEFCYRGNYWDEDHVETSFIVYKEEYGNLYALLRFHDDLTERNRKRRLRALRRTYHPSPPRRLLRHLRNVFNTLKDAVSEAVGTAVAQAKTASPTLRAVTTQQKYVNKVQSDVINYLGSSYDPILERHIGTMVVLEVARPDGTVEEHVGVFREYSPQFLEVMDVHYRDGDRVRVCDMVVPRATAVIRHSAEPVKGQPQPPAPAHAPPQEAAPPGEPTAVGRG